MSVIFYGLPSGTPTPPPEEPPPVVNPAPSDYLEILQALIDAEPPDLLPIDDDSYYARLRKTLAYELGITLAQLNSFYENMTVASARADLHSWENQVGLPANPSGKTVEVRRASILARLRKGALTREARAALVESFIVTTFGSATDFLVGGIVIDDTGISLYSGVTDLEDTYKVYEDVKDYSYVVRLNSALTIDDALERELLIYTPAGISVSVVNVAEVLDYAAMMLNDNPVWWSRLGANADDASGYANNGTLSGTTSALASPGLLASSVAGSNGGRTFTAGHVSVPTSAVLSRLASKFSLEALIKPTTIDGTERHIFSRQGSFHLTTSLTNRLALVNGSTGNVIASVGSSFFTGTEYHVLVTYDNGDVKFYINGVEAASVDGPGIDDPVVASTNSIYIGRRHDSTLPFVGDMDEPAIYEYPLSAAQAWEHFNTALANYV